MPVPHNDSARNGRAYPISKFKHRDEWIRLLVAVEAQPAGRPKKPGTDNTLTASAKAVAVCVALHLNIETGRCDPSNEDLATGTGMSERNVRRMLRELEQSGWMKVEVRGHHQYNSFELRVPVGEDRPTDVHPEDRPTVGRPDGVRPDNAGSLTGQRRSSDRTTVGRQTSESTSEDTSEEGESPPRDLGDEVSGADFEEFYRTYPKREARAKALKAYQGALKKGATPEMLLEGATRATGAYQHDIDRRGRETAYQFVPQPASWLNAERWADAPPPAPTGVTLDGNGNPIKTPPQQSGSFSSWDDAGMAGMWRPS
jgi:hypothetical protein